MMMLHIMSMQIGILEMNTKSKITLLNQLPYLSDSRYLKGRYVHIATESLKTEYGCLITCMFRNHKYQSKAQSYSGLIAYPPSLLLRISLTTRCMTCSPDNPQF